jgi:hypothetical protein
VELMRVNIGRYLHKLFECDGEILRMRNYNRRANKTGKKEMPVNGWKEIKLRKIKGQMKRLFIQFSTDITLVIALV